MTNYNSSIAGVTVARGVTKERYDELHDAHSTLTEVRGLGYKKAAELVAELGASDEILDAGAEAIESLEGFGPTTAANVISHLETAKEGWSGELPLRVEYDPDRKKPYTVAIGSVYSSRGYKLKPTLTEVSERAAKQKLLDNLTGKEAE